MFLYEEVIRTKDSEPILYLLFVQYVNVYKAYSESVYTHTHRKIG